MDDFLLLRPTMVAAAMTQDGEETFGPSFAPFFTTPYPEGNLSMKAPDNESCLQQINAQEVNVSEFNYPYGLDTWNTITWKEVLKITAYTVIFLVSLFGNFLVILVVHFNAHMRTSTNQYLVNLAAADLLVTLVCMWVHIVRHLTYPNYILPELWCRLDGFVQAIALTASVLTLTVISVGRFVAVMFPLHAHTSPDRAHRVIAAVWITSALLACPTLLYRQRYSLKWKNYTSWHCDEIWPTKVKYDPVKGCVTVYNAKTLFYTAFTIVLYFLPVLIMLINYSLVVWRLWMTQLPGEHSAPALNAATRAKRKVVKMVSVVLLVFVLCWTPLQSLILYINFIHTEDNELPRWFSSMEFAAYFIAHLNSAVNPIIYCGFNANFRQGFVVLLTCRQSSSMRIYNPRSTLKSTLSPERQELEAFAGNWRATTAGTRETTVACSGPEPAVLLEFKSNKKRFGQNCRRSLMAHDVQNSLSDSGSDSGCKRSTQCETLNESQTSSGTVYNSPSHQYHQAKERASVTPTGGRALRGLPLRGFGRKFHRAPLPAFGHMGLSGCCGGVGKRNGKMKQNLVISGERQIQVLNEMRDNLSNDTKEDML